jgi:hypothetical protein
MILDSDLTDGILKETVLKFHTVQNRNFLHAWTIIREIHETQETGRLQERSSKLRTP